ncbi:uncharacterized protein EI90DRAFT_2830623, partial [Cantharellus anzutake]|uniref:uncharacterized protein n=1 Tax=Cantharellus anzutake TaxID=1750568 RepID=UPI001904DC21
LGLSGAIEDPCWEGLGVDPYVFIKQDILHGIHKFIWDHPGEWLKNLLGPGELDRRFIAQPPLHYRVFTGGISKISQASGQEHRTYQRSILPVIAGHENIDNKVIRSTQSLLDFAYMAQYPLLSETDLDKMGDLLSMFHDNKDIFIHRGACQAGHFRIPKLHGLRHFIDDTISGGTPDNFSTETPESLHVEMCKDPYCASNRHEYGEQIINYL